MTRTKLMAAVVALVATLALGTATTLVPLATAQRPGGNDPFTPVEGAAADPQPRATTGYPGMAPAPAGHAGQWEYKFVPRKSESLEDFERLLVENGAAGWEYCGLESLTATTAARKAQWGTSPTIVFKRPKNPARSDPRPMMSGPGANYGPSAGGGTAPSSRNAPATSGGNSAGPLVPGGGGSPQGPRQETSIVQLTNAASTSLSQTLMQVFQGRCRIVPDQGTNSLIVIADRETLEEVKAVIKQLDVAPVKPASK